MSGALAGAELGGELGSVGGPPGAVVGAVVGGLIGLGIGIWAAKKIADANQKASDDLHDNAQDQPCADCGEVGCFNTPEGGDPDEMDRQLAEQQESINEKSPDEVLDALKKFDEEGRPNDGAARGKARLDAKNTAADEARLNARGAGQSTEQAGIAADAAGKNAVAGKDATHALDWTAGGDGTMAGMRDAKTNRSIGKQWTTKAPGSTGSRREELRKAAEAAKKAGKTKMDVKLKNC